MVLRIVLAGAGLCNVQVAKLLHDMLQSQYAQSVEVTLISSWNFTYYSSMYPGVLAGQYEESSTRIEIEPLAIACRAKLLLGSVVGIDSVAKTVTLADRTVVPYDILSVNIGSRTTGTGLVPGLGQHAILTRPLNVFLSKLETKERQLKARGVTPRVLIVGSGPSGIELSLVLRRRLDEKFAPAESSITIVDMMPKLLQNNAVSYRHIVLKNLKEKNIKVLANAHVREVREGEVELVDGRILQADLFIWATGCEPQAIQHNLAMCKQGFILVNRSLQSLSAPEVFGGGDCVTIQGFPAGFPPKTGAHAVREGPIVAANVIALTKYKLLRIPLSFLLYEPQNDLLTLLNLGDGRGIATKYGMTFSGEWAFQIKDYVNHRFMFRYSPTTLLGERAYTHFKEVGYSEVTAEEIYKLRESDTSEDYSVINWYDTSRRSQDIQREVNELDPDMAFDLLLESSDTLKAGSTGDFEFQLCILKRTDRDTEFRHAMLRRYEQAMEQVAN